MYVGDVPSGAFGVGKDPHQRLSRVARVEVALQQLRERAAAQGEVRQSHVGDANQSACDREGDRIRTKDGYWRNASGDAVGRDGPACGERDVESPEHLWAPRHDLAWLPAHRLDPGGDLRLDAVGEHQGRTDVRELGASQRLEHHRKVPSDLGGTATGEKHDARRMVAADDGSGSDVALERWVPHVVHAHARLRPDFAFEGQDRRQHVGALREAGGSTGPPRPHLRRAVPQDAGPRSAQEATHASVELRETDEQGDGRSLSPHLGFEASICRGDAVEA